MFIGYYEKEKMFGSDDYEEHFGIYYKNKLGYRQWQLDTFSMAHNIETLDFKISGKTYEEKKASLEDLAKDWQNNFSSLGWSYGELAEIENYFYENGKRYGLLKVFKENAIC